MMRFITAPPANARMNPEGCRRRDLESDCRVSRRPPEILLSISARSVFFVMIERLVLGSVRDRNPSPSRSSGFFQTDRLFRHGRRTGMIGAGKVAACSRNTVAVSTSRFFSIFFASFRRSAACCCEGSRRRRRVSFVPRLLAAMRCRFRSARSRFFDAAWIEKLIAQSDGHFVKLMQAGNKRSNHSPTLAIAASCRSIRAHEAI